MCDTSVGIGEVELVGLEVFPNPATGEVTLRMSEVEGCSAELYDMKGGCVLRWGRLEREMRLDVSALPRGTYMLHVATPRGTGVRRIVLQ